MLPLASGMRLGRYRLESRIGTGGMAEVWRGFDPQLERAVAVKVVQPSIARDPVFEGRFAHEARVAASLVHPHIVPVYDSGYDGDVAYIVMALLLGGDLRDPRRTARGRERPLTWLSPLASALDYAHGKGVVHRDVKPGNILFDEAGGLFLSDFGLAKMVRGLGLTSSGLVLGTPGYMSPEQAQGKPVDGRSDQFALGILAFWLLTGQTPFAGDSGIAVLHQTVHQKTPAVSKANPAVPAALDKVLERALAKEPEERYPSCRAFVEAMRSVLGGTPAPIDVPADDLATVPDADWETRRREGAPPTVTLGSRASRGARTLLPAAIVAAAAGVVFLVLRPGAPDPDADPRGVLRPRDVPAGAGRAAPAVPAEPAPLATPEGAVPTPVPRPTPPPRTPGEPPVVSPAPVAAPTASASSRPEEPPIPTPAVDAPTPVPVPSALAPATPAPARQEPPHPLGARVELASRLVEGEDARVRVVLSEDDGSASPTLQVGGIGPNARLVPITLRRTAATFFDARVPRHLVRGENVQMYVQLDPRDGDAPRRSAPQVFPVVPRTEHAIPILP